MPVKMDLTGTRFGKLLVTRRIGRDKINRTIYECVCDCGTVKTVAHSALASNSTRSCGCLQRELAGKKSRTHGLSKHPIYRQWNDMLNRCRNKKHINYANYGGRGIKVCERWKIFINFYEDMINGYEKGLSIERINVNGDYEKSNCKWATDLEQARNTTNNVFVVFNNQRICISQFAEMINQPYNRVYKRVKAGWSTELIASQTELNSREVGNAH